jgi:tRNA threonylcarbamoyl adenosine modification protein YeaZ
VSSSSGSLSESPRHDSAVVGFDTATVDTAVCATRGAEVLHERLLGPAPDGSPRHSTALLEEVERAVATAGGWDAVRGIVVGVGPGSFVGIRIGIATANGLAATTGLPVTGVCTLDALGRAIVGRGNSGRSGLAVIDARRGEVFAALYSADGERRWKPAVLAPGALAERLAELPDPPLAAGSGAVRFRSELASRGAEIPADSDPVHRVAARHLCALAEAAAGAPNERLQPIYLRPPDAQRWRERDNSKT